MDTQIAIPMTLPDNSQVTMQLDSNGLGIGSTNIIGMAPDPTGRSQQVQVQTFMLKIGGPVAPPTVPQMSSVSICNQPIVQCPAQPPLSQTSATLADVITALNALTALPVLQLAPAPNPTP